MSRTKDINKIRSAALAVLESLKATDTSTTIDSLFISVLEGHWSNQRFIDSGWSREVQSLYRKNIGPILGSLNINSITAKTIRQWHQKMAPTPITANRSLNVLSKMFQFAEEMEWRPQGGNPCKLVKPFKEKKRKRFATPEELRNIASILDREKENNLNEVTFIYLLILTGARPRSIERALWSDLKQIVHEHKVFGVLTFKGKTSDSTGEDEQVIIPPKGMDLINRLKDKIIRPKTICGIKMPTYFWNRIRIEAGCPDLWARDLRRTFATIGLSNGETAGVIGELLNHKSAETTKIYAKLINETKLKVAGNIAKNIEEILK